MSKKSVETPIPYRNFPSVDELLRCEIAAEITRSAGVGPATACARRAIDRIRASVRDGDTSDRGELLAKAEKAMEDGWIAEKMKGVTRVINATGVIIHTNLGRAPLSDAARQAMIDASGYAALEYDLETGQRGRRGQLAEELLIELTGAEAALVVNNCAAAAFFILHAFARGGEVIISRGELVEIGGDFRVPDVLEQSGAILREVGTTNRTKLTDYEQAINKDTRMLLRVHPSNYRIVGFTAAPTVTELAGIANKNKILLYEDLGSGALVDLSEYGLKDEPVVSVSVVNGADIVSFSGDKLLGGPQCGIIIGRRELIEKLRGHPLQRALRVDKKTFAVLEATLLAYRRGTHFEETPVLRQLSATSAQIRARAEEFLRMFEDGGPLCLEIIDGESVIGGGAAPDVHPETSLIAVTHESMSAELIAERLRASSPAVVTRIASGRVLVDLRTVAPSEDAALANALRACFDRA